MAKKKHFHSFLKVRSVAHYSQDEKQLKLHITRGRGLRQRQEETKIRLT